MTPCPSTPQLRAHTGAPATGRPGLRREGPRATPYAAAVVTTSALPVPPPAALKALLPPDVDLRGRLRHEAARPVWLGMVWGRLGRGDLAWQHFDRVRLPELQPWIAAERGRIVREFGDHASAEALEWRALVRADEPIDAAMLRVSLTADAVGMGDVARATSRLQAAREAVAALPDGPRVARQRLRLVWVEVEVAWLRGDPPPTDGLPEWHEVLQGPRFPPDHAAGSTFHTAKGLLFAGVVRQDPRLLDTAAEQAPPALLWAVHEARAAVGIDGAAQAATAARREVVPPPQDRPNDPPHGEL